jgi:hypothetical protein
LNGEEAEKRVLIEQVPECFNPILVFLVSIAVGHDQTGRFCRNSRQGIRPFAPPIFNDPDILTCVGAPFDQRFFVLGVHWFVTARKHG